MDFRKYAARETQALVNRLAADASEKAAGDLQALRHAFDLVAGAIDDAVARQAAPDLRDEVAGLAERLATEAAARIEAAVEQSRKDTQARLDEADTALQTETAQNAALQMALSATRGEVDRLTLEVQAQETITEATRTELKRSVAAHQAAEAVNRELEASVAVAQGERRSLEEEVRGLKERVIGSDAEASRRLAQRDDEHARALRALQAKLEGATATAATLRQRAEAAQRETERTRAEAELAAQASMRASRALQDVEARNARALAEQADVVRDHASLFLSSSLDRLLAMYLTVSSSATTDDVLTAVVDALAVQFPRVALFRVQSNHLEGVRQVGFDLRADISQVLVPRTLDSLVAQAAASGHIETRSAGELTGTTVPFGGTPGFVLALPFVIDGEALAVVYADDSELSPREFATADLRVKLAQLLQCHALPMLTRLVADAKIQAELGEYATLLLNELEQTYTGSGGGAGPDEARLESLRENLDYARRVYAERVAVEGPQAAGLFDEKLAATASARGATPFGRDLQALLGIHVGQSGAEAAGGSAM